MCCGVYMILNQYNRKCYIGSSKNIRQRWMDHKSNLRNSRHHNTYLQNAVDKYGIDNFELWVIEECSEEDLFMKEQYWMDFHECYNSKYGYNICKEAGRAPIIYGKTPWNKGVKFDDYYDEEKREELRKKYSESHKGEKNSNYGGKFHSNNSYTKGKTYEELYGIEGAKIKKQKNSKAHKGRSKQNKENYKFPHNSTLSELQVKVIKLMFEFKMYSLADIARMFKVKSAIISHIKNNRSYTHVIV